MAVVSACEVEGSNSLVQLDAFHYTDGSDVARFYAPECPASRPRVILSRLPAHDRQRLDHELDISMSRRNGRDAVVEISLQGAMEPLSTGGSAFRATKLVVVHALGREAPLPAGLLLEDGTFSPGTHPRLVEELQKARERGGE